MRRHLQQPEDVLLLAVPYEGDPGERRLHLLAGVQRAPALGVAQVAQGGRERGQGALPVGLLRGGGWEVINHK